jgi:hypothetical protein
LAERKAVVGKYLKPRSSSVGRAGPCGQAKGSVIVFTLLLEVPECVGSPTKAAVCSLGGWGAAWHEGCGRKEGAVRYGNGDA